MSFIFQPQCQTLLQQFVFLHCTNQQECPEKFRMRARPNPILKLIKRTKSLDAVPKFKVKVRWQNLTRILKGMSYIFISLYYVLIVSWNNVYNQNFSIKPRSNYSKSGLSNYNLHVCYLLKGGFQLLDLIIPELKSHVTPYKLECSHWWKIYKICSPVWML